MPEDQILGIKYGLRGFYDRDSKPVTLTRRAVDGIHLKGGTVLVGGHAPAWAGRSGHAHDWAARGTSLAHPREVLRAHRSTALAGKCPRPAAAPAPPTSASAKPRQGTSRGGANIREIVRRIDLWGLDMVFVVGGNGGNAAANAIQEEAARQVRWWGGGGGVERGAGWMFGQAHLPATPKPLPQRLHRTLPVWLWASRSQSTTTSCSSTRWVVWEWRQVLGSPPPGPAL